MTDRPWTEVSPSLSERPYRLQRRASESDEWQNDISKIETVEMARIFMKHGKHDVPGQMWRILRNDEVIYEDGHKPKAPWWRRTFAPWTLKE